MYASSLTLALSLVGAGFPGSESGSDLLSSLIDAQRAGEQKYRQGAFQARYTYSQEDGYFRHFELRGFWADENSWIEVQRWTGQKEKGWFGERSDIDPKTQKSQDQVIYIISGNQFITYHRPGKRVFIEPFVRGRSPLESLLSPKRVWFTPLSMVLNGVRWRDVLDPRASSNLPDPENFSSTARSLSDDLVEVVSRNVKEGGSVRMVCSLSLEGNVVEYQFDEPASSFKINGTCRWDRNGKGNLFLAEYSEASRSADNGEARSTTYETLEFRPDFQVPANQFSLDSLDLPAGTEINNQITGARRRLGDDPVEIITDSLPDLIQEMQSRGFSSRSR